MIKLLSSGLRYNHFYGALASIWFWQHSQAVQQTVVEVKCRNRGVFWRQEHLLLLQLDSSQLFFIWVRWIRLRRFGYSCVVLRAPCICGNLIAMKIRQVGLQSTQIF
jgi:hypothetical protein